jgi:hypothetical protein
MEDKINKIWYQMNMKEITSEEARQQVLDLFTVVGRSEQLKAFQEMVNKTKGYVAISDELIDKHLNSL